MIVSSALIGHCPLQSAETDDPAMQAIWAIIRCQCIRVAIQGEFGICNSVGNTAYNRTKVWTGAVLVWLFVVEPEDYVRSVARGIWDDEPLNNCSRAEDVDFHASLAFQNNAHFNGCWKLMQF